MYTGPHQLHHVHINGTQISINIFVHITLTIELHVLSTLQLIHTCIYACIISPPPLNNDKKKAIFAFRKRIILEKKGVHPQPPPPEKTNQTPIQSNQL